MTQHIQLPSGRVIDLDRVASINEYKNRTDGVDFVSMALDIAGTRNGDGDSFLILHGRDATEAADAAVIREWMATLPKLADIVRRTP